VEQLIQLHLFLLQMRKNREIKISARKPDSQIDRQTYTQTDRQTGVQTASRPDVTYMPLIMVTSKLE